MRKTLSLLALAVVVLGAPSLGAAATDADGYQALFNGKDLAGWKLRRPDGHQSWSVKDGVLINTVIDNKANPARFSSKAITGRSASATCASKN